MSGFGGAWPFTGRQTELAAVREVLSGDRPGSLVIVGPAGVGKTRLAREAERLAVEQGLRTRWLTATHSTAAKPLGVFLALLDAAVPAADTSEDLIRHAQRAVIGLDDGAGLVLFIDDAQHLDETSAGLVHQLVATRALPVVLTIRAGEPRSDYVTALWKDDLAVRLDLPSLGPEASGELLARVLGGPLDPAAHQELVARSQGNTLFLRELTVGALADGTLVSELGIWRLVGPLAPSERIVELVEARLRGLDPASMTVLKATAYGEPLGRRELAAFADTEQVDRLVEAGLLVCESDGRRVQVRLAHPVYADVLRARTTAMRVSEIAARLADALESSGARRREDSLRLGHWRLDGGGGRSDLLLHAARTARRHYDFPLAERLARAAADAGGGFEADLLAAAATMLQGRPVDADRQFARLRSAVATDRERADLALAHIDCLWFYRGRMDAGLVVAEQAERDIADPDIRREVSARRAGLLLGSQGPGAAAAAASPLLERAQGRSLIWLGLVASYGLGRLGRVNEALDAADRGFAAGEGLIEPGDWYPWFNLYARCEALAHAGRLHEARALAEQQYDRGLREGSSEARAWFLWNLCRSTRERGDAGTAVLQAREAIILLRRLGRIGFEHSLLSLVALALALVGDVVDAEDALAVVEELDVDPPMWSRADHLAAQAWTAHAGGHNARARVLLAEAVEVGERTGDLVGAVAALHDLARMGDAREVLDPMSALAKSVEGDLAAARVEHVSALVRGDGPALAEVSARFLAMGAHLLAAEAAADAGEAWRKAGESRNADRALARAGALAQHCPGVRTPALAPLATTERLTPRERETALLAAAGRSSREIAQELHLSARTVENRLQQVYAKFGISSRAELRDLLTVAPQ